MATPPPVVPDAGPDRATPERDDERGSMLIVALGILALLSILALTFVKLMSLEQKATTNYVDGVKARMIAEGGRERTLAQMRMTLSASAFTDPNAAWIYAQGDYWLPLEEASANRGLGVRTRASFAGDLGSSYNGGRDQYKTKVIDAQTQFNLNSEFDLNATTPGDATQYDWVYIRWLDALGQAISETNPRAKGRNPILHATYPKYGTTAAPIARGGKAIFLFRQSREGQRFNTKSELLEVLDNEDDYRLLRDYVTCHSWRDPQTVLADARGDAKWINKPWSSVSPTVTDRQWRSPININLAMPAVLTANLAGIAGRAIYWRAGEVENSQGVDQGSQHAYLTRKEETGYGVEAAMVYFEGFGYQPSETPTTRGPFVHGARVVADKIVADRATRPFTSFAEWSAWVDATFTTGAAGPGQISLKAQHPDVPGGFLFPQPSAARVVPLELDDDPATHPASPQSIVGDPHFQRWFYEGVKSLLKANFNPNARAASFNPDAVAHQIVDKGNLLYRDPAETDPTSPNYGDAHRAQTLEWCFAPKGVFEVTALGEVLGPPPADPAKRTDLDADGEFDPEVYAQAKVRGVVKLYASTALRSQADFERGGSPTKYGLDRTSMVSFPVPKVYWDPQVPGLGIDVEAFYETFTTTQGAAQEIKPDEASGYLQLATKYMKMTGGSITKDSRVLPMATAPRFALLFQDRRVEAPGTSRKNEFDNLQADMSAGVRHGSPGSGRTGRVGNIHGWPYGTARDGIYDGQYQDDPWRHLVLTPDGYLNSEVRPSKLWYRASDTGEDAAGNQAWPFPDNPIASGQAGRPENDPDATRRGRSYINPNAAVAHATTVREGNVLPTNVGGVEFWWKPTFDWYHRDERGLPTAVNPLFCGLLGVSHSVPNEEAFNPAGAQGVASRGTQMYVVRNTSGELRITRLYYEAVGEQGSDNEIPYVALPGGGSPIKLTEYWKRCSTDAAYTWPPRELRVNVPPQFIDISFARTDWWVPATVFKEWRAHEWHHLAVRWDDASTKAKTGYPSMQVWLDGEGGVGSGATRIPLDGHEIGPRYTPRVWDPTAKTWVTDLSTVWPGEWPLSAPGYAQNGSGTLPQFVRLNAQGYNTQIPADERPKDRITIGSVIRSQVVVTDSAGASTGKAGLFKHRDDAEIFLPANGTVDEVRFYDGNRTTADPKPLTRGRYESAGFWRGEIDLSAEFPGDGRPLTLGGLEFMGFLPTVYGPLTLPSGRPPALGQGGNAPRSWPRGSGSITVTFEIERADGTVVSYPHWEATQISNVSETGSETGFALTDELGRPVRVERGDKLIYSVDMSPAYYDLGRGLSHGPGGAGHPVASPILDEISVTYFLPNAQTLLTERVND